MHYKIIEVGRSLDFFHMTSFMNDPKEIRVKTAPQNFKAIDVNETAVKLQWKTNHCMKDGYTVGCSLPEGTTF